MEEQPTFNLVKNTNSTANILTPETEDITAMTIDDLIIVVPKTPGRVLRRVVTYFYRPRIAGGSDALRYMAEFPPELVAGKDFFIYRPSDFLTEDQILVDFWVYGQEYTETPPIEQPYLRLDLDDGVYVDKEQWQNIAIDENMTITTDPDISISSISFDRYYGSWGEGLNPSIESQNHNTYNVSSSRRTFNFGEFYTPDGNDDLYFVLKVETTVGGGAPPPEPITAPLTKDIKGAYIEPDLTEVSDMADSNITIHSDHHHYLTLVEINKLYPDGMSVEGIEIVDDRLETLTLDLADYLDENLIGIELKVRAEKPSSMLFFTYEDDAIGAGEATVFNATVHPPDGSLVNGDTTIVITADGGRVFNEAVEFSIRLPEELETGGIVDRKYYEEYTIYPEDEQYASYFNEDRSVIRIPLADFWIDDYYIYVPPRVNIRYVRATEKPLTEGFVTNYATTYKMDRQSLDRFSDSLLNLGDFTYENHIYNRVHSLFMIPFKLPDEMLSAEPKSITNYSNRGIDVPDAEAHFTLDNKYILPLGAIDVEGEHGNSYDYKETSVYLHAPYVEQPIGIDPTYVIDETITLNMAIDLYNGNATLNIHSTKIEGELVERVNIPIKHEIPLMTNPYNVIEGAIGGFIYNKITTPFIEVVRNIPYENDSLFGKAMSEYGRVGDFTGYIEMDETNVSTNATTTEQDMINTQLLAGVIIRK